MRRLPIGFLAFVAGALLSILDWAYFPGDTTVVMAIAPLAIAGMGAGASLLGGLFGGGGGSEPAAPQWLIDLLRSEAGGGVQGAFLPDKGAYQEQLQTQLAQIMSQLPVGMEQFNAQAAARGVFGAGEGMTSLYRDVVNPIFQTAASTTARSNLGYAQAYQQGSMQAEQFRQNALQMLVQASLAQKEGSPSGFQRAMGGVGNIGEFGAQYGLLKRLGLF
jgi:hypothetical protein